MKLYKKSAHKREIVPIIHCRTMCYITSAKIFAFAIPSHKKFYVDTVKESPNILLTDNQIKCDADNFINIVFDDKLCTCTFHFQ